MENIKITTRDIDLFVDLYQRSFMAFYQIHNRYFAGLARPTVYNRLSKLIKAKYISSLRVNLFAHHLKGKELGVIYQLTRKGFDVTRNYRKDIQFRTDLVSISFNHLYHDLLLTDVSFKLCERLNEIEVTNTKLINSSKLECEQVPDAIISSKYRNEKIALELELTSKSESRYNEIISNYRTSSEFSKIFYVVRDYSIHKKIGGIISGYKSRFDVSDDTNPFYFCNVFDIFDESKPLSITNGPCQLFDHVNSDDPLDKENQYAA